MTAKSILIWAIACFMALSFGMVLAKSDPRVSSLGSSLGPDVVTQPL